MLRSGEGGEGSRIGRKLSKVVILAGNGPQSICFHEGSEAGMIPQSVFLLNTKKLAFF